MKGSEMAVWLVGWLTGRVRVTAAWTEPESVGRLIERLAARKRREGKGREGASVGGEEGFVEGAALGCKDGHVLGCVVGMKRGRPLVSAGCSQRNGWDEGEGGAMNGLMRWKV